MGKHQKNWTSEQKLAAVQTLKSKGVSLSSREHNVSSTTLYKWERQYDQHGIEGFKAENKSKIDLKTSHLEKENRELKLIIDEALSDDGSTGIY